MILNLWMENTLHVKVFKNTSLSCIFPSFEAAHSTIKYVTVPVLAKKKKISPFGAIKYTELKADT